ncbi:Hemolysin-related protein RbmC [Chondromyces apiculatus DSM 436]|uniref:Hemolysin-related protein RbmC n=1 Tax=Chondromyces apiculatus DSM 436 TaxID=1192034 RepID=A0A017T676_9BACT|nr:Hemolysin-related protein RbmC [Chondromyces apiculatus DSM 436]
MPQPDGAPLCEYKPPVGPLTPTLEWSWTASPIFPTSNQVINMPVVVDLEKDGTPDVVIVTSAGFNATGIAYLRALNGSSATTMAVEKWDATAGVYQAGNEVQPRMTPAAADIDGDGYVEIVTGKRGGGLIAFEHDGSYKWSSTMADGVTPFVQGFESATVAIADIAGDGTPEIIVGGVVFDGNGVLQFDGGRFLGTNVTNYGAVSIVTDLDGVPPQEIVSGRRALRADGTIYWDNGLTDGYPAIADFDADGTPELVVIASGTVRVQNPTTGAVIAQAAMPGTGAAGPPTIADFDADGVPEIASANGSAYAVFEYVADPPALTLKWQQPTQDLSSNRTGSSVFDFQGDGAAEVVYNDECFFRVYDGTTGSEVYRVANSSATIHEYPVVVDVDGDNNTEVVLAANDANHTNPNMCPTYASINATPRHGVYVYGDAGDNWVRTRRVWNQHAYHITNVNADGTVPSPEPVSWVGPQGLNNYRQSSQGAGVFNAPDLQVSLEASLSLCPSGVGLRASVQNQGSLGVPAGVKVRFYRGTSDSGTFIGEAVTTMPLLPGQYEVVTVTYDVPDGDQDMSFYVEVDKAEMGQDAFNECLEDNNSASLDGVDCPTVE